MKLKSIIIKKSYVVLLAITIIISSSICIIPKMVSGTTPKHTFSIIIDAGHGGRDGGCTSANGTKESDINLAISRKLKTQLESIGIKITLTREDENGLYSPNATNYKINDMENRIKIIKKAKPDMVISIHQNTYHDSSLTGAQTFYQENDNISHQFAISMQNELIHQLNSPRTECIKGDYYILKESPCSAIIVECGYLSNANDEKLLLDNNYQNKVAYAIACGVIRYFSIYSSD